MEKTSFASKQSFVSSPNNFGFVLAAYSSFLFHETFGFIKTLSPFFYKTTYSTKLIQPFP